MNRKTAIMIVQQKSRPKVANAPPLVQSPSLLSILHLRMLREFLLNTH